MIKDFKRTLTTQTSEVGASNLVDFMALAAVVFCFFGSALFRSFQIISGNYYHSYEKNIQGNYDRLLSEIFHCTFHNGAGENNLYNFKMLADEASSKVIAPEVEVKKKVKEISEALLQKENSYSNNKSIQKQNAIRNLISRKITQQSIIINRNNDDKKIKNDFDLITDHFGIDKNLSFQKKISKLLKILNITKEDIKEEMLRNNNNDILSYLKQRNFSYADLEKIAKQIVCMEIFEFGVSQNLYYYENILNKLIDSLPSYKILNEIKLENYNSPVFQRFLNTQRRGILLLLPNISQEKKDEIKNKIKENLEEIKKNGIELLNNTIQGIPNLSENIEVIDFSSWKENPELFCSDKDVFFLEKGNIMIILDEKENQASSTPNIIQDDEQYLKNKKKYTGKRFSIENCYKKYQIYHILKYMEDNSKDLTDWTISPSKWNVGDFFYKNKISMIEFNILQLQEKEYIIIENTMIYNKENSAEKISGEKKKAISEVYLNIINPFIIKKIQKKYNMSNLIKIAGERYKSSIEQLVYLKKEHK